MFILILRKYNFISDPCPTILTTIPIHGGTHSLTKVFFTPLRPSLPSHLHLNWNRSIKAQKIQIVGRTSSWQCPQKIQSLGWSCCFKSCNWKCSEEIQNWSRYRCLVCPQKIQNRSWTCSFKSCNWECSETVQSGSWDSSRECLEEIESRGWVVSIPESSWRWGQEAQSVGWCRAHSDQILIIILHYWSTANISCQNNRFPSNHSSKVVGIGHRADWGMRDSIKLSKLGHHLIPSQSYVGSFVVGKVTVIGSTKDSNALLVMSLLVTFSFHLVGSYQHIYIDSFLLRLFSFKNLWVISGPKPIEQPLLLGEWPGVKEGSAQRRSHMRPFSGGSANLKVSLMSFNNTPS